VAYLHSTVFGEKCALLPVWDGKGHVMQQEPTASCLKLWPHLRNTLQQSSDNLSVENTIDSAIHAQILYESQLVC
jgi:hypothetical protein